MIQCHLDWIECTVFRVRLVYDPLKNTSWNNYLIKIITDQYPAQFIQLSINLSRNWRKFTHGDWVKPLQPFQVDSYFLPYYYGWNKSTFNGNKSRKQHWTLCFRAYRHSNPFEGNKKRNQCKAPILFCACVFFLFDTVLMFLCVCGTSPVTALQKLYNVYIFLLEHEFFPTPNLLFGV